jgi:hypothetical protein
MVRGGSGNIDWRRWLNWRGREARPPTADSNCSPMRTGGENLVFGSRVEQLPGRAFLPRGDIERTVAARRRIRKGVAVRESDPAPSADLMPCAFAAKRTLSRPWVDRPLNVQEPLISSAKWTRRVELFLAVIEFCTSAPAHIIMAESSHFGSHSAQADVKIGSSAFAIPLSDEFNGPRADVEALGNAFAAIPFGDQLHDLALARGKYGPPWNGSQSLIFALVRIRMDQHLGDLAGEVGPVRRQSLNRCDQLCWLPSDFNT